MLFESELVAVMINKIKVPAPHPSISQPPSPTFSITDATLKGCDSCFEVIFLDFKSCHTNLALNKLG